MLTYKVQSDIRIYYELEPLDFEDLFRNSFTFRGMGKDRVRMNLTSYYLNSDCLTLKQQQPMRAEYVQALHKKRSDSKMYWDIASLLPTVHGNGSHFLSSWNNQLILIS